MGSQTHLVITSIVTSLAVDGSSCTLGRCSTPFWSLHTVKVTHQLWRVMPAVDSCQPSTPQVVARMEYWPVRYAVLSTAYRGAPASSWLARRWDCVQIDALQVQRTPGNRSPHLTQRLPSWQMRSSRRLAGAQSGFDCWSPSQSPMSSLRSKECAQVGCLLEGHSSVTC